MKHKNTANVDAFLSEEEKKNKLIRIIIEEMQESKVIKEKGKVKKDNDRHT